jgi:ankyrin repeat protein
MSAAGNGSASLDTRGRYKTEEQAIAAAQLLLAAGANINARDRQGQTALHGAAGLGWNGLVETLASNGIDLHAKDARGRMAIDLTRASATSSGRGGSGAAHPETEALLRRLMTSTAGAPGSVAGAAAGGTP